jgi:hypothetical protein
VLEPVKVTFVGESLRIFADSPPFVRSPLR